MTEQEVSQQPIALYRLFAANDVLLYVGITDNPSSRFKRHAKDKHWWSLVTRKTVTWQPSREEAIRAEKAAIRSENPLHNIRPAAATKAAKTYNGKSEARQRQKIVALRLLPGEYATLNAAVKAQQVTLSEFIRRSALAAAGKKES